MRERFNGNGEGVYKKKVKNVMELQFEIEALKEDIRKEPKGTSRTRKEANLREVVRELVKRMGRRV